MCFLLGFVFLFPGHRQSRCSIILKVPQIFRIVSERWLQLKVSWYISPNARVSLSFEARYCLLSSCESPRWPLLPLEGYFSSNENLLFSVATFVNFLSWISRLTCCSFSIALGVPLRTCNVTETTSFLTPHEPTLLASVSSAASTPLSAFTELKKVGPCSGSGFGFKGMLWLV